MHSVKWIFISLLLILFLQSVAVFACTPLTTSIRLSCTIKSEFLVEKVCLDENCMYYSTFDGSRGLLHGPEAIEGYAESGFNQNTIWTAVPGYASIHGTQRERISRFIKSACEEETTGIDEVLTKAFDQAQPYTESLANELALQKNTLNFDQCNYTDYEIVDKWILTKEGHRDYCESHWGICSSYYAPSTAKIIAKMIENPSTLNPVAIWNNISYNLFIITVLLVTILAGVVSLFSKEFKQLLIEIFQPTRGKKIITAIVAGFSFIVWVLVNAIGGPFDWMDYLLHLVVFYELLSIVVFGLNWIKTRSSKKLKKSTR